MDERSNAASFVILFWKDVSRQTDFAVLHSSQSKSVLLSSEMGVKVATRVPYLIITRSFKCRVVFQRGGNDGVEGIWTCGLRNESYNTMIRFCLCEFS